MTITIYTPIARVGPGLRINVLSTVQPFDRVRAEIYDPATAQILCAGEYSTSVPVTSTPTMSLIFGYSSGTDDALIGDIINGKVDGGSVEIHCTYYMAGTVVDTLTATGATWDAVSGLHSLLQFVNAGKIDQILDSVRHTFTSF